MAIASGMHVALQNRVNVLTKQRETLMDEVQRQEKRARRLKWLAGAVAAVAVGWEAGRLALGALS